MIHLETAISAPVERVFDLARSIDAHTSSAEGTSERAIAGRTSGMIELDETVTWEARHFGVEQRLTVRITKLERPLMFADEMTRGAFKSMRHCHRFSSDGSATRMRDEFEFSAPFGVFGWIAERLFLTRYMTAFLERRNQALKRMAESSEWRHFITPGTEQTAPFDLHESACYRCFS